MDIAVRDSSAVRFMAEFTDICRSEPDPCLREAKCLAAQLDYTLLPLREGDLIAGRRAETPIGFLPQNSFGSVGYYMSDGAVEDMLRDEALSESDRETLRGLRDFWKGNTTVDRVKALYTDAQWEKITHGDFNVTPGFGFPLYRMSGAQMNPDRLLRLGSAGLLDIVRRARAKNPPFYDGLEMILLTLSRACTRYGAECREAAESAEPARRAELLQMAGDLEHVALLPPETFRQAMQLAWLFYLMSGAINYGRMDDYLGEYYARDVDGGVLTEDEALRLTVNLWELMNERMTTWDARVVLGGAGRKNPEAADRFAMVAMEASRLVRDSLPQLTLRLQKDTDRRIYEKALDVIGEGTTYPMLYSDEVNVPAVMSAFGVDEKTAEQYIPFGCGEYVLYGSSFGTPSGAINLLHGLNEAIYGKNAHIFENARDFDEFYAGYMDTVREMAGLLALQEMQEYDGCAADAPYLFYSLMFDDCLERGKPIFSGGIRHLGGTLESYGNVNTSDSLTAIRKLVFEEQRISKSELQQALRSDFAGREELRRALLAAPKYGNDSDEADGMAVRLHDDVARAVRSCAEKVGLDSYLMVIINNSMNTTFGLTTGASADGRRANTYMANANNPTGGMDKRGITAMLKSLLKLRPDYHAGAVQNMRFSKENFGPMREKTKALLDAYFTAGGAQAMISVLGRGDLEDAMAHPEKYPNLMVRVGGFSARFVELDRAVQLELLSRTLY